jgi:LmbE family N-acetylglucosaminyl deacetylase
MDAAEMDLALRKLRVCGSALYIAAHPDDENTAVLAYLSKENLVRTAYLSLTRGEGGQNLIGPEKGSALGILRTEELLAARSIDGARQFFTSAVDFGYSKTSSETISKWNENQILADVVRIIREFKPDIIITRFTENRGGHGHHLASAILAREAFHAAADPKRFPEQLEYTSTWQAKRIMWNAWNPDQENRSPDLPPLLSIDLGRYNPVLGKSYAEIAALSRSMHKSQGFGVSAIRGTYINHFEHTDGEPAQNDLFDGVNLSWKRVTGAEHLDNIFASLHTAFNPRQPYQLVDELLKVRGQLEILPRSFWINEKLKELNALIQSAAGLWIEVISDDYYVSPGSEFTVKTRMVNRSPLPVFTNRIQMPFSDSIVVLNRKMELNKPGEFETKLEIPTAIDITKSSWLHWDQKKPKPLQVTFYITISGQTLQLSVPLLFRWTDRVKGELYRPVEIGPAATVSVGNSALIFTNGRERAVTVTLTAHDDSAFGTLALELPQKWNSDPDQTSFKISGASNTRDFKFIITPPSDESTGKLKARVKIGNTSFNNDLLTIAYDHIRTRVMFPLAETNLTHLRLKTTVDKIGYIMGSGDEIPQSLEQIGYSVNLISDADLAEADFSDYDAIITGTRAYNVREALARHQDRLFAYAKSGGTLITLHNTRFGLPIEKIGPYPISLSRARVSDENAPIMMLEPNHPILTTPNQIRESDFAGWVQERGLYFASEWDDQYQPLFSSNDPGEEAQRGGFLYVPYGNGHYIFSAFSWFRQLPAGVPGAYRLFSNILSLGKND